MNADRAKPTHMVLDLIYTPEEGQQCFLGTYKECFDYVSKQPMYNEFKVVTLPRKYQQ